MEWHTDTELLEVSEVDLFLLHVYTGATLVATPDRTIPDGTRRDIMDPHGNRFTGLRRPHSLFGCSRSNLFRQ